MKEPNKMKCTRVQEDAIALMGVELTDEEEQKVFAHLSDCPHCRTEFRADRRTWQAISTCPVVTTDASFERMLSLRLSLEESEEPKPDQVDRVLASLDSDEPVLEQRYDLGRLASFFTSATLQ